MRGDGKRKKNVDAKYKNREKSENTKSMGTIKEKAPSFGTSTWKNTPEGKKKSWPKACGGWRHNASDVQSILERGDDREISLWKRTPKAYWEKESFGQMRGGLSESCSF